MKSISGIILLLLSALLASSQTDYKSGYLIDNDNDTVFGEIYRKTKPGKGRMVFRNADGKRKTYYPRQIQGFVMEDTVKFQSILQVENADAAEYHVFAQVIETGRLNLLATQNKITAFFTDENQQDSNNFYLEESESEKYYKLTRTGYRKQLAALISDYTDLRREVMNKVYNYEEIPEAIRKFNVWATKK